MTAALTPTSAAASAPSGMALLTASAAIAAQACAPKATHNWRVIASIGLIPRLDKKKFGKLITEWMKNFKATHDSSLFKEEKIDKQDSKGRKIEYDVKVLRTQFFFEKEDIMEKINDETLIEHVEFRKTLMSQFAACINDYTVSTDRRLCLANGEKTHLTFARIVFIFSTMLKNRFEYRRMDEKHGYDQSANIQYIRYLQEDGKNYWTRIICFESVEVVVCPYRGKFKKYLDVYQGRYFLQHFEF